MGWHRVCCFSESERVFCRRKRGASIMRAAIRGESRGSLPVRRLRGRLVPAYLLVLLLGAGAVFQPTAALAIQWGCPPGC